MQYNGRMRTILQQQASRANGAKSRGPTTAEGKAASSRNATRCGLLAGSVLVDGKSEQAFLDTLPWHEEVFQPADKYENKLVEIAANPQTVCIFRVSP